MIGLENINMDEINLELQYRLSHVGRHISDDFIKRIDQAAEEVKWRLSMPDFLGANEAVKACIEMIQNEIQDAYSKCLLAACIIEESNYAFFLPAIQDVQAMFGETWHEIVKEGDSVFINSHIFHAQNIAAQRLYFDLLAKSSQDDT